MRWFTAVHVPSSTTPVDHLSSVPMDPIEPDSPDRQARFERRTGDTGGVVGDTPGRYSESVREYGDEHSRWRGRVWMARWEGAPEPEAYEGGRASGSEGRVDRGEGGSEGTKGAEKAAGLVSATKEYMQGDPGAREPVARSDRPSAAHRSRNLVVLETMLRSSYRAGYSDAMKLSAFAPAPAVDSPVSPGGRMGQVPVPEPSYGFTTLPLVIGTGLLVGTAALSYLTLARIKHVQSGIKETLALVRLRDLTSHTGQGAASLSSGASGASGIGSMTGGIGIGALSSTDRATMNALVHDVEAIQRSLEAMRQESRSASATASPASPAMAELKNSLDSVRRNGQKTLEGLEDLRHPLFGLRTEVKALRGVVDALLAGTASGQPATKQARYEDVIERARLGLDYKYASGSRGLGGGIESETKRVATKGTEVKSVMPTPLEQAQHNAHIMPMSDLAEAVKGIQAGYLAKQDSSATPDTPGGQAKPLIEKNAEHVAEEGQHLPHPEAEGHTLGPRWTAEDHGCCPRAIKAVERHATPLERVMRPSGGQAGAVQPTAVGASNVGGSAEQPVFAERVSMGGVLGGDPTVNLDQNKDDFASALEAERARSLDSDGVTANPAAHRLGRGKRNSKKDDNDEEGRPPSSPVAGMSPLSSGTTGALTGHKQRIPVPVDSRAPRQSRSQSQAQGPAQPGERADDGSPSQWWSFHSVPTLNDAWRVRGFGWYTSSSPLSGSGFGWTRPAEGKPGRQPEAGQHSSRRGQADAGQRDSGTAGAGKAGDGDRSMAAWALARARKRLGDWPF
ncbi:hypothetical protein IAU60_003145 [Kwoniella sp. DSM 27419]